MNKVEGSSMNIYRYCILFVAIYASAFNVVSPIDNVNDYDKNKAYLGKKLFMDTRLSKDNTVACLNCHNVYTNGAETTKVSTGINNQQGTRNSPTVFNARYNFVQFWDGRAKDLEEQALMPITNPIEMGNTIENVVSTISKDKEYVKSFSAIYPDGITPKNIANALSEFEKALTTKNSKFDQYLNGDKNILTQNEIAGFELFQKKGCISCHNGKNIGGSMFQKFGAMIAIDTNQDMGRYNITNKDRDKYIFKVPSLRNVLLTAPYFHDGSVETVQEAIKTMANKQIGRTITDDEVVKIIAFLNTLNGELPAILKEESK